VDRRRGGAFHAEPQPLATIQQIHRTIGEHNFAGQYQQRRRRRAAAMVKAARFRNYAPKEWP
jgi:hypothetical protein